MFKLKKEKFILPYKIMLDFFGMKFSKTDHRIIKSKDYISRYENLKK